MAVDATSARRASGFTLMETLVMLVMVSLAVTLMFQMLGNYRIAKERVAGQAGAIDRRGLVQAWFVSSMQGLVADIDRGVQGDGSQVAGLTLSPLVGSAGAPTEVTWSLADESGAQSIVYAESGQERWRLPLRPGMEPARFVYLDGLGEVHDQWPPAQGIQDTLPAAVGLALSDGVTPLRVVLGSVRANLRPREEPFELEQE